MISFIIFTYDAETDAFHIRIPPNALRLLRVGLEPRFMLGMGTRRATDIRRIGSIIASAHDPFFAFRTNRVDGITYRSISFRSES